MMSKQAYTSVLHCQNFNNEQQTLLNKVNNVYNNILNQSDLSITQIVLYGDLVHCNF